MMALILKISELPHKKISELSNHYVKRTKECYVIGKGWMVREKIRRHGVAEFNIQFNTKHLV
jgi:hypothetical protein